MVHILKKTNKTHNNIQHITKITKTTKKTQPKTYIINKHFNNTQQ